MTRLKRALPEDVGVRLSKIEAFLDDAKSKGVELHSFMVYRQQSVIAEGWWWPYQRDIPHMLHSATKSFLAVAVGIAIHENYFGLHDKVVSFFPDYVLPDGEYGERARNMTVEHLLTQTSGHGVGQSGGEWRSIEGSWVDKFFNTQFDHEPGSEFVYSSATSFMLSAIVTKTTGVPVRDFLEPRLFRPLGIKLLNWDDGPEGVNPGGNGISCLSEDFLKLGILHLQKGMWEGKQILPKEYVEASTISQRGNPYGYHWWTLPDGAYQARGMFGQYVTVLPNHDAVVMVTGGVPQGALALKELISQHFPSMFLPSTGITSEGNSVNSLQSRLDHLHLIPYVESRPASDLIHVVSKERYAAKRPNEDGVISFTLDFPNASSPCIFHLHDHRGFHKVHVGLDGWQEGATSLSGAKLHHGYEFAQLSVVSRGRWTSEDTFEMTLQFNETAFRDVITVTFLDGGRVAKLDRSVNVNSFGRQRPTIWCSTLVTGDELLPSSGLGSDQKITYSIGSSSVGELLDNPETRAILDQEVPAQLLADPRLEKARMYTFEMVGPRVKGMGEDVLARIDARLAAL
ncbi:unnamed protein product [Clonostachys rosea]|uniref:Beta-lactamase-related domain-containing protein n=1 Tax=Bionectria ochroleuca TaxID=29856 RepID=A0ABY6TW64_BIOOC|nr:unnamed protein product [Clonostachys rosea]